MKFKKYLLASLVIVSLAVPSFAQKQTITITATSWAPYTDEKLEGGGFLTEICQTAFAKVGYKTKIKFNPWKRAVQLTKLGKTDALIGASFSKERTNYFSYPNYNWESNVHLFAKKGHTYKYENIKNLCPAKLGLLAGSNFADDFKDTKCIKIDFVPSIQQNIKKVSIGRLDFFLEAKDSVMFYLNHELSKNKDKIQIVNPAYKINKVYMVLSKKLKNYEQIQADFDKGIEAIKKDGSYDKILVKHGMK